MLKKTLVITAAICATLFAVATVVPAVAGPRKSEVQPSPVSAPEFQQAGGAQNSSKRNAETAGQITPDRGGAASRRDTRDQRDASSDSDHRIESEGQSSKHAGKKAED